MLGQCPEWPVVDGEPLGAAPPGAVPPGGALLVVEPLVVVLVEVDGVPVLPLEVELDVAALAIAAPPPARRPVTARAATACVIRCLIAHFLSVGRWAIQSSGASSDSRKAFVASS
jgi:hypothetical protein